MEAQAKPSASNRARADPPSNIMQLLGLILRGLVFVLMLVSAILMCLAKQTKTTQTGEDPITYEPHTTTKTMEFTNSSALIYLLIVNAIAGLYSILSLVVGLLNRLVPGNMNLMNLVLSLVDILMIALLFSAVGASAAFSLLGEYGNSQAQWPKFCDAYSKFCTQTVTSVVLSIICSIIYVVQVILGIIKINPPTQ